MNSSGNYPLNYGLLLPPSYICVVSWSRGTNSAFGPRGPGFEALVLRVDNMLVLKKGYLQTFLGRTQPDYCLDWESNRDLSGSDQPPYRMRLTPCVKRDVTFTVCSA
ncbi:hypothetical protein ElyMa_006985400 [Elysia marginata]|uniref:Uncharacterized protein n=1 Tax=Elysia marginata TaxID=1093978 RepID=A0AAV4JLM9_9GAST|nr:hypothetical protein ElyMa_006985400 [Elysia marginata]